MNLPEDQVSLGADGAANGVCARLGEPVTLIDLAPRLGRRAGPQPPAVVLCLKTARGLRGFLVDQAEALQSAVPEPMPWCHGQAEGRRPRFTRMIRVRAAGRDRAACVLSLAQLAEAA